MNLRQNMFFSLTLHLRLDNLRTNPWWYQAASDTCPARGFRNGPSGEKMTYLDNDNGTIRTYCLARGPFEDGRRDSWHIYLALFGCQLKLSACSP